MNDYTSNLTEIDLDNAFKRAMNDLESSVGDPSKLQVAVGKVLAVYDLIYLAHKKGKKSE